MTLNNNTHSEFDHVAVAAAWAHGWTLARDKLAPVPQAYGHKIDLGAPDHLERHVVANANADMQALRALAGSLTRPGTWLKVCASVDTVAPLLPAGWSVQPPEYLMAVALRQAGAITHNDYRLSLRTSDAVSDAELRDKDGQLAASGRVALSNGYAIFDQVVTDPAHRRKGLGRIIMAALSELAIAGASSTGVLVATEEGRALYEAIGWRLVSPVTAAVLA
ncbi:MAG: GNAT family N-acetyltransferase [Pseudomonadota bacterium]